MHLFKFIKPFRLMSGAIALLLICSLIGFSAHLALFSSPELQSTSTQLEPAAVIAQAPDFGQAFQELGIEGAIVIYDKNNQRFYEHNPSRNTTAFFPASTFKILNALISQRCWMVG